MRNVFMSVALVICIVSAVEANDYIRLDKQGNYKGYVDVSRDRIDTYDKNNMPSGWMDRSSGATYDGKNNFKGWIIESDPRF